MATRTIEKKESVRGARMGGTKLAAVEKMPATISNHEKQAMTRKAKVGVTIPTTFFAAIRSLSPPPRIGLPGRVKTSEEISTAIWLGSSGKKQSSDYSSTIVASSGLDEEKTAGDASTKTLGLSDKFR